jgi:hypothetical protein
MSAVVSFVSDVVESVVDAVGDVVETVVDVVEDAVEFVGDTVQAVIDDPLPTLLMIAGSAVGIPPAITSAAITAARGGDLQDIVAKYHARNPATDTDRTAKFFSVPRSEIEGEGYDLSMSRYKNEVFEEVHYDDPSVILDRLIAAEVGDASEVELAKVKSGIVRELLELKGMMG